MNWEIWLKQAISEVSGDYKISKKNATKLLKEIKSKVVKKSEKGRKSMKKNIKKIIVGVGLITILLAGCQKKVECDSCGKSAVCQTKTIFGEEVKLCDECIADAEEMAE